MCRTCQQILPAPSLPPYLQVVSDDGGVLACALNAACAALLDAAVPLRTLCAAVSAAQAEGDGGLLLDPTAAEEAAAAASATFAFLPLLGGGSGGKGGDGSSGAGDGMQLLSSQTRGRLSTDQLLDMMEAAKQGADRLAAFMQQSARQAAGPLAQ